MRRIISLLAVPLVIVGLVWLAAVIYLQQSNLEVTGSTLLYGFVIAPLVLVLCWFGGKAIMGILSRKPEAPQVKAVPVQVAQSPAAPASRTLAILSTEVHTSAGDGLDSILAELREGKIRPSLSERFNNQDGLPVMTSLSESLDIESTTTFLDPWLAAAPAEHPGRSDPHKAQRLLALLEVPLLHTLELLQSIPPLAVLSPGAEPPRRPLLVKLFTPAGWEDMLEAWLRQQLVQLDGFNTGFVRADTQRPELQYDALRVTSAFSTDLARMPANSLLLLVSTDSCGTEHCIEELEQAGRLFDGSRQNGRIPGEAAALILSCPADQIPSGFDPIAKLHPAAWGVRQKAVDAGGRTDVELLSTLLSGLLEKHPTNVDDIATVVSDCDQRIHWNAEATALISANLPALDPIMDHLALGRAFGNTGAASSTLALACAAACVRESAKAGFIASVADTSQRSLALLCPWPEATT